MKKPDVEKPAFQIFPAAKDAVEANLCPFCGKEIKEADFCDDLSKKEYGISGLCQDCQDDVFT